MGRGRVVAVTKISSWQIYANTELEVFPCGRRKFLWCFVLSSNSNTAQNSFLKGSTYMLKRDLV